MLRSIEFWSMLFCSLTTLFRRKCEAGRWFNAATSSGLYYFIPCAKNVRLTLTETDFPQMAGFLSAGSLWAAGVSHELSVGGKNFVGNLWVNNDLTWVRWANIEGKNLCKNKSVSTQNNFFKRTTVQVHYCIISFHIAWCIETSESKNFQSLKRCCPN